MKIGIPRETTAGEQRVAMVPDLIAKLVKAGLQVVLQTGAGEAAGFPDATFTEKGATLAADPLDGADVLLKVQPPTPDEIGRLKEGATYIGYLQPYTNADGIKALAARKV